MRLTEQRIIGKRNVSWKECDRLCFASKNLYNQALYRVIEHYKAHGTYKNYNKLDKEFSSENQVDYRALPAKVAQQTLRLLDYDMKSFFEALKKYRISKEGFNGEPQLPRYKHKTKGRSVATFTEQAISKKDLRDGYAKLSMSDIRIKTDKKVQQVRIIPLRNRSYQIEMIYLVEDTELVENERYAGADVGINNLAAVVTNCELRPMLFNGRPLKAINQFYNKQLAEMKAELPLLSKDKLSKTGNRIQKGSSNKTNNLTHKRNCKVKDYMHKASRRLVNILKQANISKVVIGQNKQWKTGVNIGSKNNQKFVSIPHAMFINMLVYKLRLCGIDSILREESYTSKCSFLDNESIEKHDVYMGKRISRGLFRTASGKKWNADCNGAANILKKEFPNAFSNGIEALVVSPTKVKFCKNVA